MTTTSKPARTPSFQDYANSIDDLLREAERVVVDWETGVLQRIFNGLLFALKQSISTNADLVAALRKLHDAVDQQTAYAIKCKLEVIDHSYIMTVLSEARAALARATEGE